MPHDGLILTITYDEGRKRFRHNDRTVSRDTVRREIDKLTAHIGKEAARIGRRYARKSIGIAQFEREMRELIKSGHIIAASVGRGGRSRMTQADWGRVGKRLRTEYGYLAKMSDRLVKGTVAKAITPNRAKRYASSIVMSYHETVRTEHTVDSATDVKVRLIVHSVNGCAECQADADRDWIPVEDMTPLGDRICGNFCRCTLEFSDDV